MYIEKDNQEDLSKFSRKTFDNTHNVPHGSSWSLRVSGRLRSDPSGKFLSELRNFEQPPRSGFGLWWPQIFFGGRSIPKLTYTSSAWCYVNIEGVRKT